MSIQVVHAPSAGPLTLTPNADGFSVAGGTTPRTLTVTAANVTLNQSLQTTDTPRFLRVGIGIAADAALGVLVSGATSNAATVKVTSTDNATSGTVGAYVNAIGGIFRAYGSTFGVTSLANKAAFGPDGATGIVVFSNANSASGGTGSVSLRGGGYDTESERVFIDKDGVIISGKTQTTNVNALQVTQTWNAAGVAFTAMKLNVTNTNSAAAALLVDYQIGTVSQWKLSKAGVVTQVGGLLFTTDNSVDIGAAGATRPRTIYVGTSVVISGTLSVISTGGAAVAGEATLVAGTVTVNTTAVLTATKVLLTRKSIGGTIGTAITYTIVNATSFTINSDNPLDTSTFSWFLVNVF